MQYTPPDAGLLIGMREAPLLQMSGPCDVASRTGLGERYQNSKIPKMIVSCSRRSSSNSHLFSALQIFHTPDVLPLLIHPLSAFLPSHAPELATLPEQEQLLIFINGDLEALQESCMLIESLSLDVEDIRLSLARGLHFPAEHSGVPCLSIILDFIENGTYPLSWNLPVIDAADRKRKSKAFDICKAALIKTVVEVAGEEGNEDVLWDDSEPAKPGGDFVDRMVNWLKRYVNDMDTADRDPEKALMADRDDMAICASLALGNLSRRGVSSPLVSHVRNDRYSPYRKELDSAAFAAAQPCSCAHIKSPIISLHGPQSQTWRPRAP